MTTFTHDGITYTQEHADVLNTGTRVIIGPSQDPQDPHRFTGQTGSVADETWQERDRVWVVVDDYGEVPFYPTEIFPIRNA